MPAIPHDGQVPSRAEALHSLAGLIAGACVHASDKKAGALMDVIFAPQGWRLRYLVAATGGTGLPWHQRVVEAERVEGIGFAASTIALGLSRKELHRTLDLHELDDLDSKWYSKLLACYGIGTTT